MPGMEGMSLSEEFVFERGLTRLEEIVGQLERGDLDLDAALRLYEEGVSLARQCTAFLDQAEERIGVLAEDPSGRPVVTAQEAPGA